MSANELPLRVFIGHDPREDLAYRVCRHSLVRRASRPVLVQALRRPALEAHGMYRRRFTSQDGVMVDEGDGKPFSTEFAFSRFLVPALCTYRGWALFCDCDFLWRGDVAELFDQADERYAVMVVPHDHAPGETVKMDGQVQARYRRKNWSSLILWNCGHPSHERLTVEQVNQRPGAWLHGFDWLADDAIGALDEGWNWLEGWSPDAIDPKAVHFTRGGPWFEDYRDVAYADEWRAEEELWRYSLERRPTKLMMGA